MLRYFPILSMSLGIVCAQSFEVASIKPAAPMQPGRIMVGSRGGPGTGEPGQITFTNSSIADLIQSAYDVKSFQVTGPGWLQTERFDVIAKVPAGATKAESRIMLQHLLADRFKLVLHRSTKESSIYALVVAKGGPKLTESAKPADAEAANEPGHVGGGMTMMIAPGGRMRMVAQGTTIAKLVDALAMQLDRPVVDMTGLAGTYDLTLEFAPDPSIMQAKMAAMGMPPPPPPPDGAGPAAAPSESGPLATIFTALPEQLGLRLEARKGPVELLVVDSAEKTPADN
jgi:uncharacterized protein (TIGR03435 family)